MSHRFDPIWDIKRHVQRQAKDLVARVPPVDSQYLEYRHDLPQELEDIAVFQVSQGKTLYKKPPLTCYHL